MLSKKWTFVTGGTIILGLLVYFFAFKNPVFCNAGPTVNPSFMEMGGKPLSLSTFKGKPLIINLWASWCGYCVRELPSLDRLAARMRQKGGDVLTIVVLENSIHRAISSFENQSLQHLKFYYDERGEVAKAFQAAGGGLPLTIFVNKNGCEVYRHRGALEWDGPRAEELIRQHLGICL